MAKDTPAPKKKKKAAPAPAPTQTPNEALLGAIAGRPAPVPAFMPEPPAPAPAAQPSISQVFGFPTDRITQPQEYRPAAAPAAPASAPAAAPGGGRPDVQWGRPAPQGMGGMDLGALAHGARAETNTRVQGQGSLMDAYLEQVLGQASATHAAGAEREGRMQDFDRQRAVMQEALQRSRTGQDEALQRARIESAASEGMSDRDHRGLISAEQRAFELGQAAVEQDAGRDPLEQRMLELQIQQMEQELGPQNPSYGKYDVSADRGGDLSAGRQDALRGTVFTEQGNSGAWGPLNLGASDPQTQTYEDLIGDTRGLVDQFGLESVNADPIQLRQGLLELARNQPQLASLLLSDIGYNPAAFLAE